MKNTMKILMILAGLSLAGVYRDAGLGLYPFLKMDVGARVAALGGTGAVNGDELAIFSNPALLAGREASMAAGYNDWFGSTRQNYIAAVTGLGRLFTGSLAFRSVYTSGIEYRESASSDPSDTFNASDFSINGAIAASAGRFDLGLGIKIIHEKIWLESSNGWAVDLGFNYHPAPSVLLTAAYLHSGPAVIMDEEDFRFPRTWVFGSKWNNSFSFGDLSVSGQLMRPLDNQTRAGFGMEFSPVKWAALRGGWKLNDNSSDLTAGAGFNTSGWALDYAFVPGSFALGTSHRFSLSRSL